MENINENTNENGLSQILQSFKENITLIVIGIYSVSFMNYYLFYESFNINILNYIGLNELLFFTLEYFFNILISLIVIEICFLTISLFLLAIHQYCNLLIRTPRLYLTSNKQNRKRLKSVFLKKFSHRQNNFRIIMIFIFIIAIFITIFHMPNFFTFIANLVIFAPLFGIYFFYSFQRFIDDKKSRKHLAIIAIFIVIISSLLNSFYNVYNKKFEKDEFEISFYNNAKFISTERRLLAYNYLGETSTHIFIYDLKKKESKVIFKENINEINIKSTNTIDYIIKSIQNIFGYITSLKSNKN
ncbi:hypothetical protein D1632_10875 [Chryseobacterium nematophagum]|uniref:Uncharacterized protein n=1 Tax=Chryseobacterium nematophagum TaxID=2305228 RepID=A0A3M7LDG7_9FLAO|nr:hypothetical protein [Chryseobacterium nematophagum]RMZ60084.1 hypothetical protein D1632_10875 [Chryseobacterium nematophagum]